MKEVPVACLKIEITLIKTCHRFKEKFEDTKGVIRSRKSKDRQHNDQKKKEKQQSTIHPFAHS
jgi:hypothetical protein